MSIANRPTRRSVLQGAALSVAAAAAPSGLLAEAPFGGVSRPSAYRFRLGAFEVATFLDGAAPRGAPNEIFGTDQDAETVAALLQENFLPGDQLENQFTPVLLNTGPELILFDTGFGDARGDALGGLREGMASLGYAPEQVDKVVLTHFHPDHVLGMLTSGARTFPNAEFVAPQAEFDFWRANIGMRGEDFAALLQSRVFDFAEEIRLIADGEDIVTGVTAMAAYGHTPGHTLYHLQSEDRRLLITADTANHFVASLQRPDWHVLFDMDKEAAAQTRRRVFDMVAAERIPFAGYHMPFPAVGFVEPFGEGFRYVPASYQLNL